MIVVRLYKGEILVRESEHLELIEFREKGFRPFKKYNKLADRIYFREYSRAYSDIRKYRISKRTFREWLKSAYEMKDYYMYVRYQVVKMFFQSEPPTRKSPKPFADVRAWHFVKYEGEDVDNYVREGRAFGLDIIDNLVNECEFLTGLMQSLVLAHREGSIERIHWGYESEQVEEDELTGDVCETYRACLFYRRIKEFVEYIVGYSYDEIVRYWAENLFKTTGVYLENDIRDYEKEFLEKARDYWSNLPPDEQSKFIPDKLGIISLVKNEDWETLSNIHKMGTRKEKEIKFEDLWKEWRKRYWGEE